jgi:hypothetical protein
VGYVDGTLGSCSAVDEPCASSYDDRPGAFIAPWQYDGSTQAAKQQLVQQLQEFGASVEKQTDDYVYAVLDQGPSGVLDLEFVFAPNDTTVRLLQPGCRGVMGTGCLLMITRGSAAQPDVGGRRSDSMKQGAAGLSMQPCCTFNLNKAKGVVIQRMRKQLCKWRSAMEVTAAMQVAQPARRRPSKASYARSVHPEAACKPGIACIPATLPTAVCLHVSCFSIV